MSRTIIALVLATFCTGACAEEATPVDDDAKAAGDAKIPLAIDGYCAVSLVEPSVWTKGEPKFQVVHKGLRYFFLSEEEKLMFEEEPEKYAIALGGLDLVATYDSEVAVGKEREKVYGNRNFIGRHDDRTYLFATMENLMKFNQQPHLYVQQVEREQRVLQELNERIRKHEEKRGKTIAELYPELQSK